MSILIRDISYIHTNKNILFQNLNLSLHTKQKASLLGNNGTGKSTLLRIVAGLLSPSSGKVTLSDNPYYVPQHFGQYDNWNISQALGIDSKLNALYSILNGDTSVIHFTNLNDYWNIEENALQALSFWNLDYLDLHLPIKNLSGGEKTKIFLAGIQLHSPTILLLDEPSNHLDLQHREKLYEFIQNTQTTLLVVSHDRTLLNLLDSTYELNNNGITYYNGNYNFYKQQKEESLTNLESQLNEKEKSLRKARKTARETIERKEKQDSRGEKKQRKAKTLPALINKLRNKAEESSSKLKNTHFEKIELITEDLQKLRKTIPDSVNLKMNFESPKINMGKVVIHGKNINFGYHSVPLWENNLNFLLKNGDRMAIQGSNGSGKTTLLKLFTQKIKPTEGFITFSDFNYIYVDQEYSLLNNQLNIWEQIQQFNIRLLQEHELKTILNRFLFPHTTWEKKCAELSGGEKMKLILCCLMIKNQTPDVFLLDEPTNNIDIQSLEILTTVLKEYKGTLVVISHDEYFLNEIGINQYLTLQR